MLKQKFIIRNKIANVDYVVIEMKRSVSANRFQDWTRKVRKCDHVRTAKEIEI